MSILEKIVSNRKEKIQRLGHSMGKGIPKIRRFPIVPFGTHPFIICEFKRRSPSKGAIYDGSSIVKQVQEYVKKKIKSVSILTEEDFFSGSINDLLQIKELFPHLSLLRKDFIIDEEDIAVSYRIGADAVLLIASLHDIKTLKILYRRAKSFGIEVLFEIHNEEDLDKARQIKPSITGINSRNLTNFTLDPIIPVRLAHGVDWKTQLVFESGIRFSDDVQLALSAGFSISDEKSGYHRKTH
jgi:indole-3-glycerol phosphate synthase/phosphoribosylanthranilate isomerase